MRTPYLASFIAFCCLSSTITLGQIRSDVEQKIAQLSIKSLVELAGSNGDAQRGAILFHQPNLQCAQCHTVYNSESKLGPNLASWGEMRPNPEELVRSILDPSQKIREGYQTLQVLTTDAQVLTGVLVEESPTRIVIREASQLGAPTIVDQENVLETKNSPKSIMPEGLLKQLQSVDQFFDLLAYVIEISEQGPTRARELQPPAALTSLPPLPEYESRIAHADMLQALNAESLDRGKAIYNRVCANCHGTLDREGSLPTSPRFGTVNKLKNGNDPFQIYQTLTNGHGLMVAQRWMVPQQKYDVIHYIREFYFREHNSELYVPLDENYLSQLPKGDTFGPEPVRYEPYVAMDYGPSLINTYEIETNNDGDNVGRDLGRNPRSRDPWENPDEYFAPGTAPNYAYKGIAVRLDEGPGGVSRGSRWMVYDHDTLSLNAAWSGDSFIDYCCIQFDGQHNTHNRLTGEIHIENPVGPGWGQPVTETFFDPRPVGRDGRPYGPLPRTWYQFQGLFHYGLKTILKYRVGGAEILEQPSVIEAETPVFVRNLSIGPSPHRLVLRIADSNEVHARVVSSRPEMTALIERDDVACLLIHPHTDDLHVRLLFSDKAMESVEPEPPIDLSQFTQGGPPRWPERVTTTIQRVHDQEFAVDEFGLPSSNPWNAQVRATGIDFYADDSRAALCTWDGDVWVVDGVDQTAGQLTWQRIASGLFQPLGIRIVNDQVFVTCRDQLVLLRDLNGDLETDFYQCFNSDHQVTEHFHEFAMGLQTDQTGNFYYAKSARHAKRAVVPHHGTLLKITPDGQRTEILATGFRAANGVCINPDGSFFVTDQEGHWNPKNRINWVEPGGFYGNMYSFTDVLDSSDDAMEPPLCWITNAFDRSPAELLWVPEDAWGALGGSLLNLSYGYGKVYVVPHERMGGQLQGGMCQLPIPDFPSGSIRGRFHPSTKDLFVCGMFSWAGSRQAPGSFHRVRYDGKPAHLPLGLNASTERLEINFSHPLDPESVQAGNFHVRAWDIKRTPNYGSKHFNERSWTVTMAELESDGQTVLLHIPELAPTWCMSIEYDLQGANGRRFDGLIHNTIHRLAP